MTNENEKRPEKERKNSVLFENDSYNEALRLKEEVIKEKDETIGILTKQLGERDQTIISKDKEIDNEKKARIIAENSLSEEKDLKIEHKGNYYKSEEERFADAYRKACQKIRNK